MSGWGMREDNGGDRMPFPAGQLKDLGIAVAVVAYADIGWIQRTFRCTEAQAKTFKANAGHDFDSVISAAIAAHGRRS